MKRFILAFVGVLALAGCSGEEKQGPSQQAIQSMVGKSLAGIEVQTIDGEGQPLNDALILNGKPVVVNVWATWCTPCLKEMPTLDALGKQGRYTVIAIATDKDTQTVKEFLKQQEWGRGVTVLFDRLGAQTREKMGAISLPVTFVTDPSLTVKMAEAGERDWNHVSMQSKMLKALQQ